MQDFSITTPSRVCAATGRELQPGDVFVSALVEVGDRLQRRDYARGAWKESIEGCVGWWRSHVPTGKEKPAETPREVMLGLLNRWQHDRAERDRTYVLALWLVRRKVLRFDDTAGDVESTGSGPLRLYCPSTGASYDIAVAKPSAERQEQLQTELTELLYGNAA